MFIDERQVSITSALGNDVFQLRRFHGHETLSEPYRYVLELRSANDHIKADKLLGTEMALELQLPNLSSRQFTGFVMSFTRMGKEGRYAAYRVVLGPWLALMTLKSNCRIFQHQPVPDIVSKVAGTLGIPVMIEMKLGGYATRPYTVQYRETDFNFISRLLAEEGIYYYFNHKNGRHSMMLIDAAAKHEPVPQYASIPYYPPTDSGRRDQEHISSWSVDRNIVPGNAAVTDFDYEYKQVALRMNINDPQGHANDHLEMFDYPGGYCTEDEGRHVIQVNLERLQRDREFIRFDTNARGLHPGATFSVRNLVDVAESDEFLAIEAHYTIESDALESSGASESPMVFQAQFLAMDNRRQFRAVPASKKPEMRGPHSAIVTGPPGTEIYSDPQGLGRVLVQFHWDRYADASQNDTSCWVRVSQPWAGPGFGFVQIPRVGEEVLVDFLDGDPDRPVIVGRLYNGKNKPPYALPDNATQSGMKTRSSPKGHADNFNEIRFEDKKGKEEMFVQAERDQHINIKNNQRVDIGNNRTKTIVLNERSEVGGERFEQVAKKDELIVGLDRTETVQGNAVYRVDHARHHTVGTDETIEVMGMRSDTIGKGEKVVITEGGQSIEMKGLMELKIDGDRVIKLSGSDSLTIGKALEVTVEEQFIIKCGSSSILLKKNGDVVISGKNVVLKSDGAMTAKASKDLVLSGSKVMKN